MNFLANYTIKNISYAIIIISIGFEFQEMSSFKKINISFVSNEDTHSFINKIVLPLFSNISAGEQTR